MDFLTLGELVASHDEAGFTQRFRHDVLLMGLEAAETTQEVDLAATSDAMSAFAPTVFELAADVGQELLVGRSPQADVLLDHAQVSMRHATLVRKPAGTWVVRDNGSTNGTKINGSALPRGFPMPLQPGGVLELGTGARLTLLDPARLYRLLRPMVAPVGAAPASDLAAPDLSEEQLADLAFYARCDPLPPALLEEGAPVLAGRSPDCGLVLPHGSVSRRHVRLVREGTRVRVEDLGSSNGTLLGRERVQQGFTSPGGPPVVVGPFEVRIAAAAGEAGGGESDTKNLRLQDALRGRLETMPLGQLLQSVELNENSGAFHVQAADGQEGAVEFQDGVPLWARFGQLRGSQAVLAMLRLTRGDFTYTDRPPAERPEPRISGTFTKLILESSRTMDETKRYDPERL